MHDDDYEARRWWWCPWGVPRAPLGAPPVPLGAPCSLMWPLILSLAGQGHREFISLLGLTPPDINIFISIWVLPAVAYLIWANSSLSSWLSAKNCPLQSVAVRKGPVVFPLLLTASLLCLSSLFFLSNCFCWLQGRRGRHKSGNLGTQWATGVQSLAENAAGMHRDVGLAMIKRGSCSASVSTRGGNPTEILEKLWCNRIE